MGQLQPASSLSPGGLLPDGFQPFIVGFSEVTILNVCSHCEQSFRRQNQHDGEGRESAKSRHREKLVIAELLCKELVQIRNVLIRKSDFWQPIHSLNIPTRL